MDESKHEDRKAHHLYANKVTGIWISLLGVMSVMSVFVFQHAGTGIVFDEHTVTNTPVLELTAAISIGLTGVFIVLGLAGIIVSITHSYNVYQQALSTTGSRRKSLFVTKNAYTLIETFYVSVLFITIGLFIYSLTLVTGLSHAF